MPKSTVKVGLRVKKKISYQKKNYNNKSVEKSNMTRSASYEFLKNYKVKRQPC